jgi:hypothetical protein
VAQREYQEVGCLLGTVLQYNVCEFARRAQIRTELVEASRTNRLLCFALELKGSTPGREIAIFTTDSRKSRLAREVRLIPNRGSLPTTTHRKGEPMVENPSQTARAFGPPNPDETAPLEHSLRCRLGHRIKDLRVWFEPHGLVIAGRTRCYYDKQLAQHAVREIFGRHVADNRITVDSVSGENRPPSGHHGGCRVGSRRRPQVYSFPN